jgi:hypothetical protein
MLEDASYFDAFNAFERLDLSNAKGTMVLTYSENIECDFDGLVEYLNCFQWNLYNDDNEWFISDSGEIINKSEIGVTVFPSYYEWGGDDEGNGGHIRIGTSLEFLADNISDYITSGFIEIACVGNYDNRYIYIERLKVDFEGNASILRNVIGTGYDDTFEETCMADPFRKENREYRIGPFIEQFGGYSEKSKRRIYKKRGERGGLFILD